MSSGEPEDGPRKGKKRDDYSQVHIQAEHIRFPCCTWITLTDPSRVDPDIPELG